MISPPRVRPAILADAEAIAATHVASWQVAYRGFFPSAVLDYLSVAERRKLWEPRLEAAQPGIWVSEGGGQVNGFVYACPSRDDDLRPPAYGEIAALYVHPAAWGTGAGRALCHVAFEHFRHTRTETVIVWVLTANTAARHFYERIGFTADDGRKDITMFNITLPETRYRMSLR